MVWGVPLLAVGSMGLSATCHEELSTPLAKLRQTYITNGTRVTHLTIKCFSNANIRTGL